MSSEVLNSPIIHTTQVHLQVISSQSRTWPDDVRMYILFELSGHLKPFFFDFSPMNLCFCVAPFNSTVYNFHHPISCVIASAEWPEKKYCSDTESFFLCRLWATFGARALGRMVHECVQFMPHLHATNCIIH